MVITEDGEYEFLSEDKLEALVKVARLQQEVGEQEHVYCDVNPSPTLIVAKKALTLQLQDEPEQRCNLFQTKTRINGRSIKVIIGGGSCHNLASQELCSKFKLKYKKHPRPYHVQWLSGSGTIKIQYTIEVSSKIGAYEDMIEYDVVPMIVYHLLLRRPWQYD